MKKKRIKGLNLLLTKLKNVHSNGHLLLLCEPKIKPVKLSSWYQAEFRELTQKHVDNLFKKSPTSCKVIGIKEGCDSAIFKNGVMWFQSDSGGKATIQKDYYLYILHHFPDAKFKLNKENPDMSAIGIFNKNKKVGYVMPCRGGY